MHEFLSFFYFAFFWSVYFVFKKKGERRERECVEEN